MFVNCVSLGEGGRNYPKKTKETEKTTPKFEICCSLRGFFFDFFGLFRYFSVFCGTFSVFSV